MKTALTGLDGVISVEHQAGADVFVVRQRGQLSGAAQAVDRIVILKWARRGLETLGRQRLLLRGQADVLASYAGRAERCAAHISELVRSEDGVQRAVEIFQRYYA